VSQYPAIPAGVRLTTLLLSSMLPFWVRKAGDTNRNTTTVLAADPDLQIALEANATYRVTMIIHYSAGSAGGFKTQWSVPSGATGLRSCWGVGTSPTSTTDPQGDGRWGIHGFTTDVSYGTRNSTNQVMCKEEGDITTTTAGTLALMWAQTASSATDTRVAGRSYLEIRRLA
jgi:hypothetical protein